MIVNAHTHMTVPVGGYDETNVYGIAGGGSRAAIEELQATGVDACYVFVAKCFRDATVTQEENRGLAAACREHPDRLYPWCTVNPYWPERKLREEIRYCIETLGMHGIKLVPICQGYPLSGPGMDVLAEEAIRLNVPLTTHDGSPEYCSAIQTVYLARKFPELRVLSGHAGLRELWPDYLETAGELPNLTLCLSGPTQWGMQALYDRLGPEKLLFGSDGGLGHKAITTAYLRRIEALRAPPEHKAMILGENAMRFLGAQYWPPASQKR